VSEKLVRQLRKHPRQRVPDEKDNPILTIILDTYHVFDTGTRMELEEEEFKRQAKVCCADGCTACCLRPMVPATEIEILGLWWFLLTRADDSTREMVIERLLGRKQTAECPFLINNLCSIYPMRPLACRILHVFTKPCDKEEYIYQSRRGDVWSPSQEIGRKSAVVLLDYYGFKRPQDKVKAYKEGFIPAQSRFIPDYNWEGLIKIYREGPPVKNK